MKNIFLLSLILTVQITNAQKVNTTGSFHIWNDEIYNTFLNSGDVAKIYMGFDGGTGYVNFGAHTGSGFRNDILYMRGSDGNVGLGTINPSALLHLNSASPVLKMTYSNGGSSAIRGNNDTWILGFTGPSGAEDISFGTQDGNGSRTLTFSAGGSAKMKILSNGNIGIGTNAPETLLNVNVGSGGSNGIAGIRVGGLNNYSSLELGIDGDYDGMIRSYGNNLNYYAGHWKTKGSVASENHSHNWYTSKNGSSDWSNVKMILNENGNLGIGVINPQNKLDVNGTIHSKEVKVDMTGWSDFVFKKDYNLPTLDQVEKHIVEKGHLQNIPSEEEVLKNGINLGEMNAKLLQKIEEMTLYMIEMKKEIEMQNKEIELLKAKK